MESIIITPENEIQQTKILDFLKELNISFQKKKIVKKKIDTEKEAFLYTSQKNAAKLFAKYL